MSRDDCSDKSNATPRTDALCVDKNAAWANTDPVVALARQLERELADATHIADRCDFPACLSPAMPSSTAIAPAHLQDAPRVKRNTFTVPNPDPQAKPKEIEVVFSSFAACIERETNQLRATTVSASTSSPAVKGLPPYPLKPVAGCKWPDCDYPGRWDCNASHDVHDAGQDKTDG